MSLLCLSIKQIGESKCKQQREQAGCNDDNKQLAHVRLQRRIVLRQRDVLYLDEAAYLGTNLIHQPLALTITDHRQYASHVMVAAQGNDLR